MVLDFWRRFFHPFNQNLKASAEIKDISISTEEIITEHFCNCLTSDNDVSFNSETNNNSKIHPSLDEIIARAEAVTAKIDLEQSNNVLIRQPIVSFNEIVQVQDYIILDFETTGLQAESDRITEFCIQFYSKGQLVEEFSEMVNPGKTIPDIVIEKTGITNEMLADKKDISAYLDSIVHMVNNRVIVGHNIKFDLDFLASELLRNKYNGKPLTIQYIDTLKLSRSKINFTPNHKLETLKKFLNINVVSHRAGNDCFVTNELFTYLKR